MKVLYIAWKDMLIRLRDRNGLLIMLAMPLVLTAILGAALGGVFDGGSVQMPKGTIAVYNGDDGDLGKGLVQVFDSADLKKSFDVESYASPEDVKTAVAAEKSAVGLVIPKNFSQEIFQGQPQTIHILQDPTKPVTAEVVKTIVTAYAERASTVSQATQAVIRDVVPATMLAAVGGGDGARVIPASNQIGQTGQRSTTANIEAFSVTQVGNLVQQVTLDIKNAALSPQASVKEQSAGAAPVTAKQYYSAAMAVMFLLFNATVGAKMILTERHNETLPRLLSTPTRKGTILLGKFFGTLCFSLLQFVVLLVATRLAFGVNWGDNVWQIGAVALGYSIAVSGLAMLAASLFKTAQSADSVMNIAVQIFSILGGSMIPLSSFPDLLQKIAKITPNAWALNGLLDVMSGTTWSLLLAPLGILLTLGGVSLCIGTWRLQAR